MLWRMNIKLFVASVIPKVRISRIEDGQVNMSPLSWKMKSVYGIQIIIWAPYPNTRLIKKWIFPLDVSTQILKYLG